MVICEQNPTAHFCNKINNAVNKTNMPAKLLPVGQLNSLEKKGGILPL
jgi:hypothetical protein